MNDADMIDDLFGIKLDTFESILSTLYSIENCEIYDISIDLCTAMRNLSASYNRMYNKPGFKPYWNLYKIDYQGDILKVDIDTWDKFRSDNNLEYNNFTSDVLIFFSSDDDVEQVQFILSEKFNNMEFSRVADITNNITTKYKFVIQILNVKD